MYKIRFRLQLNSAGVICLGNLLHSGKLVQKLYKFEKWRRVPTNFGNKKVALKWLD